MSINVLWVEEELPSLRYERKLAERNGWNITTTETVSEAISLIRDKHFDLVVIDLILPMDENKKKLGYVEPEAGLILIDEIRRTNRIGLTPPVVPMLVITAVVSPDKKAQVIQKLSSDRYFLNKPLREQTYSEVIEEINQQLNTLPTSPIKSVV